MCISFNANDFERHIMKMGLTRSKLDEWLKAQTEDREYHSSYELLQKFGVHLGLDRSVSVELMNQENYRFVDTVHQFVSNPLDRVFGAARDRLIRPKGYAARSLDSIPA